MNMEAYRASIVFAAALAMVVCSPFIVTAQAPVNPGELYNYPDDYADGLFKPHELGFGLPQDEVARAEFYSQPFYAIILKSGARCTLSESERVDIQAGFPDNKVFVDRLGCEDEMGSEEFVGYEGVNPDYSFLAVHAGSSLEEASGLLARLKSGQRFPGANIRNMRAFLAYP